MDNQSIVQMLIEAQQVWCRDHSPRESVPVPDHPLGEEHFPNIQSEIPLLWLHAIPFLVTREKRSLMVEVAQQEESIPLHLGLLCTRSETLITRQRQHNREGVSAHTHGRLEKHGHHS